MRSKDGYRSWLSDSHRTHEAADRETKLDGTDCSVWDEYVLDFFHAERAPIHLYVWLAETRYTSWTH